MGADLQTVKWTVSSVTSNSIAITDTSAHFSDAHKWAMDHRVTYQAFSSHNQTLTLTWQGSMDGTNWTDLPNPETVTASGTAVATLSDPWFYTRIKAVAGVAPASGSLTVLAVKRRVETM